MLRFSFNFLIFHFRLKKPVKLVGFGYYSYLSTPSLRRTRGTFVHTIIKKDKDNRRMRGSSVVRIISRSLYSGASAGCGGQRFAQVPFTTAATSATKTKKRSVLWWTAIGFGAGAVIGVGAGYNQIRKARTVVPNPEEQGPIILSELPDVKASRSIKYPTDASGLKITLFQYQTCPFCCKVRAMLDFFGISYDIVEVNSIKRTETKWSKSYKKVPILVVQTPQGEILQLNDSTMIISALYSYLLVNNGRPTSSSAADTTDDDHTLLGITKYYPSLKYNDESGKEQTDIMNKYFLMMETTMGGRTKEDIVEERKWRKWTDDVYVHTLSPNIYRSFPESLDSFKYFDQVGQWENTFSNFERSVIIYLGATAMWIIGKRLKKRHNLKNDVRTSLFDESDYWVANIKKKGGKFMGGESPNLSDLAVYGVLSAIEGCQAFKDLTSHSKPLEKWYFSVKSQLKAT